MAHKKKHKKKKAKSDGTLAFVAAILSQAIGQILGDAAELAVQRLSEAQDKASRAMKKKKRHAGDGAQAVSP